MSAHERSLHRLRGQDRNEQRPVRVYLDEALEEIARANLYPEGSEERRVYPVRVRTDSKE